MRKELTAESRLLASYTTYKALYEEGKNVYDIAKAFLNDAISHSNSASVYSLDDLAELVKKTWGIRIPSLVIGTVAKKLKCLKKVGDDYQLFYDELNRDDEFTKKQMGASEKAVEVFHAFHDFLNEHNADCSGVDVDSAFLNFLLDENVVSDELKELISTFIIKNSSISLDFKNTIDNIRCGHCLLTGLTNNNAVEYTNSWNNDITIFLDTEILFHLVGYNGELWKKVAKDFIDVIKDAREGKGKLNLKYFSFTKEEISDYFISTKLRMNNPDEAYPLKNAMRYLLSHCKNESDLIEEEGNFFHILKQYGIHEYKENLNDSKYDDYNLVDTGVIDKYYNNSHDRNSASSRGPSRDKVTNRVIAVSNINKLRKGIASYDYRECEYIFVTGTLQTIAISHDLLGECFRNGDIERWGSKRKDSGGAAIEFAVSLSQITNAIWYRLNNTLLKGKIAHYPVETDSVVRAQLILSSLINSSIDNLYENARIKLASGELSKDDIAVRLESIANRQRNPEDITAETIDKDITILRLDDIEAVRNEKEYLRNVNEQKDERISELEKQDIEKSVVIQAQSAELEKYRRKEEIGALQQSIKEKQSIIERHESAEKHINRIEKICKAIIVLSVVAIVISIFFLVHHIGWNIAEEYSFYIQTGSSIFSVLCMFLGIKIGLQVINGKLSSMLTKKYKKDINENIEAIKREHESDKKKISELKEQFK